MFHLLEGNYLDDVWIKSKFPPTSWTCPIIPLNDFKRRFKFEPIVQASITPCAKNLLRHGPFRLPSAIPKDQRILTFFSASNDSTNPSTLEIASGIDLGYA